MPPHTRKKVYSGHHTKACCDDQKTTNKPHPICKVKKIEYKKPLKKKNITTISTTKIKRTEKQYDIEVIKAALNAKRSGLTFREVSDKYGIPRSTLHNKLNEGTPLICRKGAPTVLPKSDESDIVKWVLHCYECGFRVSRNMLIDKVHLHITQNKIINPFKDNRPGKRWYNGFMKRHSGLNKIIVRNKRVEVHEHDLDFWFATMKRRLQHKGVPLTDPTSFFKLDVSSFIFGPKNDSVSIVKGEYKVSTNCNCSTAMFITSATGEIAPPMILLDIKKSRSQKKSTSIPENWQIGYTENGLITTESLYRYITDQFIPWMRKKSATSRIALYIDNYALRINLKFFELCNENGIELVALFPNSTNIIQPIHETFFNPLKEKFEYTFKKWREENGTYEENMFPTILNVALQSEDYLEVIKDSFLKSGLFLANVNISDPDVLIKIEEENEDDEKNTVCDGNDDKSNVNAPKFGHDNCVNDHNRLLHLFETEIISAETLKSFKLHEFKEKWTGDLSEKALFEAWCKLKNICCSGGSTDST